MALGKTMPKDLHTGRIPEAYRKHTKRESGTTGFWYGVTFIKSYIYIYICKHAYGIIVWRSCDGFFPGIIVCSGGRDDEMYSSLLGASMGALVV